MYYFRNLLKVTVWFCLITVFPFMTESFSKEVLEHAGNILLSTYSFPFKSLHINKIFVLLVIIYNHTIVPICLWIIIFYVLLMIIFQTLVVGINENIKYNRDFVNISFKKSFWLYNLMIVTFCIWIAMTQSLKGLTEILCTSERGIMYFIIMVLWSRKCINLVVITSNWSTSCKQTNGIPVYDNIFKIYWFCNASLWIVSIFII